MREKSGKRDPTAPWVTKLLGHMGATSRGLTIIARWITLRLMQMTIEIPAKLAKQLEPERERLAEIIARGLRRTWSGGSTLRREVISFLARRPAAEEIIEFRPSERASARARELLRRNHGGALTPEEEAELDELCELDRFVSLIKAEVLARRAAAA
jgi:hypothetical protein